MLFFTNWASSMHLPTRTDAVTQIIDCHQHFWKRARGDYGWLSEDLGVIYADFAPEDLKPQLADCGVAKTIAVQAAATIEETQFMLSLADENDFIAGVVGWVDLEPASAADNIAMLAAHPKLKGIRPMIQDIDDPAWIADPDLAPGIEALVEHELRFDALVHTRHIDSLLTMMARHPDLPVVIDHGAKPPLASGDISAWREKIALVAEATNAYCKVSGLVTEADVGVNIDDIRPVFDHLYEHFGADRLMWGSDWPVVKLRMEYADWMAMTRTLLSELPADEQRDIAGDNASRFYDL